MKPITSALTENNTKPILLDNNLKPSQYVINTAGAVLHLAMRSAQELTDLVAEVHSTITDLPTPLNKTHKAHAHRAPLTYRLVSKSFALLARLSRMIITQNTEFNQLNALRSHAALNGVCGDKLEAWSSPLALSMTLRGTQGALLDPSVWAQHKATGHVLFLHGLCHNDLEWQQSANHLRFVEELTTKGYQIAWLRYNTGRAIHANGQNLAELLARHFGDTGTPIWLIGHSMGGLLIRSASHYATEHEHGWINRLSHAAYLGSPHLGAPWEVAGNHLNNMLGITPYTRPFMRLGNIRSVGIRDLRVAHITAYQTMPQLTPQINHLLLATAWSNAHTENWIGDGIVPVSSALAQNDHGNVLTAPNVKRVLLNNISHLAILDDAHVYAELRGWLEVAEYPHL
jgi:pimeloyl-ACP methyl ester carboxylesterase